VAKLYCRTGSLAGVDHQFDGSVTIGRAESNDLALPATVISQSHAQIVRDPDTQQYVLEDLESRNGTRVDGIRVDGRQRLGRLHVVTFGEVHDFLFVTETREGAVSPAPQSQDTGEGGSAPSPTMHASPGPLAVPPLDQSADGTADQTVLDAPAPLAMPPLEAVPTDDAPSVTLEIVTSDGDISRHTVGPGRHEVGRAPDCAVVIDDRTLSRRHALLLVEDGRVSIADQDSRHGTFVAGTRVSSPVPLSPGVEVLFGELVRARLVEPEKGDA